MGDMGQVTRPVIDYSGNEAEAERRSRAAYQAFTDACMHTGYNLSVKWESLLDDEKYQWRLVYDDCWRDAREHEREPP
jgi:hypothetical protein